MGGKNELGSNSSRWGRRPLYSVSKSDRYTQNRDQERYYRPFGRYYRRPTSGSPNMTVMSQKRAIPVLPHFFPVLPPANFWLKTALRKLQYLLNPDSDFDVLRLVEIATTSPTTICIETSLSSKGGYKILKKGFTYL